MTPLVLSYCVLVHISNKSIISIYHTKRMKKKHLGAERITHEWCFDLDRKNKGSFQERCPGIQN